MQPFIMAIDANELEKRLISMEKKVSKILDILSGNEIDKEDNGILGTVNKHDSRITDLEKWKDRLIYTVMGMGAPAAIGIWEIIKKITLKN